MRKKKKKMRKRKKERKKEIYEKKRKNMSMCENKNKVNSPVFQSAIGISRLQD
jgi:hypothetical protein